MKKKIVLIPGAWSNELVFRYQIESLINEYDIHVHDLAGFKTINEAVTALKETHSNVHCLIGLSLGGFIVQQTLIEYPNFTEKAVLISTHAHAINDDDKAFYFDMIKQVGEGKLAELASVFAKIVISHSNYQNEYLMSYVKNIPMAVGAKGCINHHRICLSYTDNTHQLKYIQAKTLVLCSKEDTETPIKFHETLHQHIPGSELYIAEQGGHFITLEQPEIVNQQIRHWLSS